MKNKQFNLTCKQIATLTLHPNVVLTARAERPRSLNNLEKDCVNVILGLSSATTMHVRTQDRLTPFIWPVGGRKQQRFKFGVNNSSNKSFQFVEQTDFKNTRVTDMNRLNDTDADCAQFGSIHPGQPAKIVPSSFVAGFEAQEANCLHHVAARQPLLILSWKTRQNVTVSPGWAHKRPACSGCRAAHTQRWGSLSSHQRECEPAATGCGPGFPSVRSSRTEGQRFFVYAENEHNVAAF